MKHELGQIRLWTHNNPLDCHLFGVPASCRHPDRCKILIGLLWHVFTPIYRVPYFSMPMATTGFISSARFKLRMGYVLSLISLNKSSDIQAGCKLPTHCHVHISGPPIRTAAIPRIQWLAYCFAAAIFMKSVWLCIAQGPAQPQIAGRDARAPKRHRAVTRFRK